MDDIMRRLRAKLDEKATKLAQLQYLALGGPLVDAPHAARAGNPLAIT